MQLIATIIFFNDELSLLQKALSSVAGADRIICVDGPYADWPHGGKLKSDDSVLDLVRAFPKTELIEAPNLPYLHQIDKRNQYLVGKPGDWYVNIDADEELRFHNGFDWAQLKNMLASQPDNIAWLDIDLIYNPSFGKFGHYLTGRRVFKHLPGIHYSEHHARLWDVDGHRTALEQKEKTTGPWLGMTEKNVDIFHNKNLRDANRLDQQGHYYRTREHA